MVSSVQQVAATAVSATKTPVAPAVETAREFLTVALVNLTKDYSRALFSYGNSQAEAEVHSLRIAARKLRGMIALINHIKPSSRLQALALGVKATAKRLSKIRELDVLMHNLNMFDFPARHATAATELMASLTQLRNNSVARLPAANGNRGIQRHSLKDFAAAEFDGPARDVAEELLDHLLHRANKKARKLKSFSDEQRHDLRIAIKNLRYGIELFAPLFDDSKTFHRYLKQIRKLQIELGTCNDAATARALLSEMIAQQQPDVQEAAAHFLKTLEKTNRKAAKALPDRWHRMHASEPFWR